MSKHPIRTAIVLLAFAAAASAQTPAGGEFPINTYTTSYQHSAHLAIKPGGDFVVVWTSNTQDGSSDGAFGQRFAGRRVRRRQLLPGGRRSPASRWACSSASLSA